jgi:hypothetical protein
VDDRMVVDALDRRLRAPGSLPVRARHVLPPVAHVVEAHRAGGLAEDERSGDEQLRFGVRILRGVERALGDRDVRRRADEAAELGGRHRALVHPEAVNLDATDRALSG